MNRLKRVLWLPGCVALFLWVACQDPVVGPAGPAAYARIEGAMFSGLRALLKAEGITLSTAGYPGAAITVEGKPTLTEDEGKGSGDSVALQRFALNGMYAGKISQYTGLDTNASPLERKLGTKRSLQVASVPCPTKVGDTWVLEGAQVEDIVKKRSGKAKIIIGTDGIKVEVTYSDGTQETIDLDLDKGSPLKIPNYAALFEEVYNSDVNELSDNAIQSAEADKNENVANFRIVSQTTIHAKSESKNGKVLKEISRSSDLIFSKSNEYNTTHFTNKNPTETKGKFSAISVFLSTAGLKGRGLSILYTYRSKSFDCPKLPKDTEPKDAEPKDAEPKDAEPSTSEDAGTTDTPLTESPTPDKAVDCSQYQAGASFPSWYAGTQQDSKVCQAMYDKVYGTNGQNILCKTNADCNNPCRFLCCGSAGRLDQVLCQGGTCTLAISGKCGFCFDNSTDPQNCTLPDEFKQP